MSFFSIGENYLEFQNGNEVVRIIAWGTNSLRVVSAPSGELDLSCCALLTQDSKAEVAIEGDVGSIGNGKIHAVVTKESGWNNYGKITFYNQKGEVILKEAASGGALLKKARFFKSIIGGDFQLKATFEANHEEKIYGMGQYQQDIFDLKGCNLELAHRNSQASIPFYLSNKGYGFFGTIQQSVRSLLVKIRPNGVPKVRSNWITGSLLERHQLKSKNNLAK